MEEVVKEKPSGKFFKKDGYTYKGRVYNRYDYISGKNTAVIYWDDDSAGGAWHISETNFPLSQEMYIAHYPTKVRAALDIDKYLKEIEEKESIE